MKTGSRPNLVAFVPVCCFGYVRADGIFVHPQTYSGRTGVCTPRNVPNGFAAWRQRNASRVRLSSPVAIDQLGIEYNYRVCSVLKSDRPKVWFVGGMLLPSHLATEQYSL